MGLLFTVTSAITHFIANHFFIGTGAAGIAVGFMTLRRAWHRNAAYAGIHMAAYGAVFSGTHLWPWRFALSKTTLHVRWCGRFFWCSGAGANGKKCKESDAKSRN